MQRPPVTYAAGQEVEYHSATHGTWLPCKITEVRRSDGAVQVNVKEGAWLSLEEQAKKLRAADAPGGKPLAVGAAMEFWSMSHAKWVPCQVLRLRGDGAVELDVKPGVWISPEEQSSRLQAPRKQEHSEGAADGAVYELLERQGYISGVDEDRVASEAEARGRVLAAPDSFMGYTVSTVGNLAYARKLGNRFIAVEGWRSYILSCKALDYSGPLFKDDICENGHRFKGGFENGKGGSPWAIWKRPGRGEGLYDRHGLQLFRSIHPNDPVQGGVGDCSLIACISALAEFPGAVQKLFMGRKALSRSGCYALQLWDWRRKSWCKIVVDDRFPLRSKDDLEPAFARISADTEIYPMLVEKAVAVMAGGFDFMNAIMPTWALGVLTGCPAVFQFDKEGGAWTGFRADYDGSSTFMTSAQHRSEVWDDGSDGRTSRLDDQMWRSMEVWDQRNYMLCCGIAAHGRTDAESVHGLFYMHAYSLLQVKSNIRGSGISLAQLRNPHGSNEPDLPWKEGDRMWALHPEVARALSWTEDQQVDDGTFWLSKEDFFKYFNVLYLVKCDMEHKGVKLGSWRPPR